MVTIKDKLVAVVTGLQLFGECFDMGVIAASTYISAIKEGLKVLGHLLEELEEEEEGG